MQRRQSRSLKNDNVDDDEIDINDVHDCGIDDNFEEIT